MQINNNENRISLIIVVSILLLVGVLSFALQKPSLNLRLSKESYTILQKWEMPRVLDEISGIAWAGANKIACVQDEDGIIFIYNLSSSEVEKTINFSKAGDYEGIAVVNNTAFVLRADGKLFEVSDYLSDNFEVKTYNTPFSERNDMESLTYDGANHRLLLVPKERGLQNQDVVGIYSFNLNTKKLEEEPILQIDPKGPIFSKNKKEKDKSSSSMHPSDIAINPVDGNYYLIDGKKPQLLIMDPGGEALKLYHLREKTFKQPEGIIFSPDGILYISNEGKNGTANIMKVELDQ